MIWVFIGRFYRQLVRVTHTFAEMMRFGIAAMPIAILLAATIGLMLAIQSLYSLGLFGAQNFAYIGIALSVTHGRGDVGAAFAVQRRWPPPKTRSR